MIRARLHITIAGKKINAFHFFGIPGYVAGVLLGIGLAWLLDLDTYIVLLMAGIGSATFFLLALLAKWITGKDSIVYYHHEIAILLFCALVLHLLHLPVLRYIDITILGIGLFLAFGRIGCLSVGCCHGKPSRKGVCYGSGHVAAGFTFYYKDTILFPVQLIEALYVTAIVIAGSIILYQQYPPGTVLIVYTVIYGAFRFALEFFRGDPDRPYWLGLSEAQWTTLLLVGVSLLLVKSGYLPSYSFHTIIFLFLLVVSACIILVRNNAFYTVINPRHIRDIASGLKKLSAEEKTASANGSKISMHCTELGLCLSKGKSVTANGIVLHYTVSSNNKRFHLTGGIVKRIAVLIKQLGHHHSSFEIIEKEQQQVFHIVFEQYKAGSIYEIKSGVL